MRCSFGDIVLVPFPFTDLSGQKKRPAVVVSVEAYHQLRPDLIVMAVTSQLRPSAGDVVVSEWKSAGLLKPSAVKPVISTIERSMVLKVLGRLADVDQAALRLAIRSMLG